MQTIAPAASAGLWESLSLWQGFLYIAEPVEVQVCICAIPLHADDLQVTSKVASIQAGDGQTIPVASKDCRAISVILQATRQGTLLVSTLCLIVSSTTAVAAAAADSRFSVLD